MAKSNGFGYQGKDLSLNNTMEAFVKHFALYGIFRYKAGSWLEIMYFNTVVIRYW